MTAEEAESLGFSSDLKVKQYIKDYRNGRDITQEPRGVRVIDLFGLTAKDAARLVPSVYQWVLVHVKPERDQNRDAKIRSDWWQHGRPRPELSETLSGLSRFITTVETSKHRFFAFLSTEILPDNKLVNIAMSDAYGLGILSSTVHVTWALAVGSRLGIGNDPVDVKTACFETFPFPDPDESTKARIRELGEQLDAHRKRQQELHPDLTMTGMYNVLEKLRAAQAAHAPQRHRVHLGGSRDSALPNAASGSDDSETAVVQNPESTGINPVADGRDAAPAEIQLTAKEKKIHEQGLVSVLKQIHDELDVAVFDAYGWPHDLTDEEILERLVKLNHERAAEEAKGLIRWLRPEFQNPDGVAKVQTTLIPDDDADQPVQAKGKKQPWPKPLPERITLVRKFLVEQQAAMAPQDVAVCFSRAKKTDVEELLDTLVTVGQARQTETGLYVAAN